MEFKTLNVDIDSLERSTQRLPIDTLSKTIQEVILHMEEVFQCPRDFATCSLYCACSSMLGNRVKLSSEKYTNTAMVWLSVVADSGSNKSTPFHWAFSPIRELDEISYQRYKAELQEWKRTGDEGDNEKPIYQRYLIDDITPEGRNKVLSENPLGITLNRDEIKGMLDDIGRYNRSGEVSQMLSIWDGRTFSVTRKSEEALMISEPFMTVCGGIQPDLLRDSFGDKTLMSNGYTPRWLFCYPEQIPPPMYNNVGINKTIENNWREYIFGLQSLDYYDGIMYLDSDANKIYVDYYNRMQIAKGDADSYIGSMISKLQIYVLRFALLTHFLSDNVGMTRITGPIMAHSVDCMNLFEQWHRKVYVNLSTVNHVQKKMGNEELLREVVGRYSIKSQTALADALGISKQALSKALKKDD